MFTVLHDGSEYAINHIKSAGTTFAISDVPELDLTVINRENNPAYPFLNEEAVLLVDGYEWRVKAEAERTHYKILKALHVLIDLDDMPFNQLLSGTYTPSAFLSTILADTGFTLDLDDTELESVTLEEFGRTNRWEAFKNAVELLQAEFTVLPGRIVQVKKQLSRDKGEQFRYGYNVKSLVKKTDSSDIVTHVIVYYGEDYEHEALFISPTAANYDREYYGDIIKDARITNIETAQKKAAQAFKDIDLSYEIDCIATNKVYELGEIVHTIYEPLNDLDVATRVMSRKYDWNGEDFILEAVTVGNYSFKTAEELLQEQIKKSENDANEKLDEAKKVIQIKFNETEQRMTDQYTTITSEYTSAITLTAQELRTDMTAQVTTINTAMGAQYQQITAEYNSSISQTAQQLRTDFNATITSVNDDITVIENNLSSVIQTTSSIQSTVNSHTTTLDGYGTRISSAESSIIQQAGEISQRVSYTDYTGANITSLINQDPYAVSISASKINLNGAVMVNGSISGASTINVTTGINIGNYLKFNGNSDTVISSDGFGISIAAWNEIEYVATEHIFWGNSVDFSRVNNVTGINYVNNSVSSDNVGGYTFSHSSSGGKTYLTVRHYGSYVGLVELS